MAKTVTKLKLPKLPVRNIKLSFPKLLIINASPHDKKTILSILMTFFVVFILICISALISKYNISNNNTSALYFFSAVAQTLGALLGIVLAATFVILPNIKTIRDSSAQNIIRRLIISDPHLTRSVKYGALSICLSLSMIIYLYLKTPEIVTEIVVISSFIILYFSTISLIMMYIFIFSKTMKYMNPLMVNEIFNDYESVLTLNNRLLDWTILFCFQKSLYPQLEFVFQKENIIEQAINNIKNDHNYTKSFLLKFQKDLFQIDEKNDLSYQENKLNIINTFLDNSNILIIQNYLFNQIYIDDINTYLANIFTEREKYSDIFSKFISHYQNKIFIYLSNRNTLGPMANMQLIMNYIDTMSKLITIDISYMLLLDTNSEAGKLIYDNIYKINNADVFQAYNKLIWYILVKFTYLVYIKHDIFDYNLYKNSFIDKFNLVQSKESDFKILLGTYEPESIDYKIAQLMLQIIFKSHLSKGKFIYNDEEVSIKLDHDYVLDRLDLILDLLQRNKYTIFNKASIKDDLIDNAWNDTRDYMYIVEGIRTYHTFDKA